MPSILQVRQHKNPDGTPAPAHVLKDNSAWRALHREEIIEPERPIIDAHHHLWDKPGQTYLIREFLADAQSGHNIKGTVYIEGGSYYGKSVPEMMKHLGEVEFANGMAAVADSQAYGTTLVASGIVGGADLTFGAEIAELLDAQAASAPKRYRGIRLITKWDADEALNNSRYVIPPGLLSHPQFLAGYAQLGVRGLSFDAMVYHPQLLELAELARAFPETTINLNHIGGLIAKTRTYLSHEAEATQQWQASMRELARCPNVFVKLGGLGMPYLGFGMNALERPADSKKLAEVWGPYFNFCIETFGPERCMFESNFPPDRDSVEYHVVWNAFKRIAMPYTSDEKHALFFDTAAKAYRLKVSL
ncbi:amidohydrolase family protein [Zwartia panacis]|uniref:amidohydrolase family protein n=1 Tax=Zwartia panacis TaxID=2683345 RepID=UPI0025B5A10A|nr:amidohydrolase family protein [Zwartia panacis]MDN4016093.1 amidohydrolase family protein [Zwartia panacis]